MRRIIHTRQLERDIKLCNRRGKDMRKFREISAFLVQETALPIKYRDHKLVGNYTGCRECHIEPDWLLIYKIDGDSIIFERTGTHSDLF